MIARNAEDESVAGAVFYGCDVIFNVNCRELTVNCGRRDTVCRVRKRRWYCFLRKYPSAFF